MLTRCCNYTCIRKYSFNLKPSQIWKSDKMWKSLILFIELQVLVNWFNKHATYCIEKSRGCGRNNMKRCIYILSILSNIQHDPLIEWWHHFGPLQWWTWKNCTICSKPPIKAFFFITETIVSYEKNVITETIYRYVNYACVEYVCNKNQVLYILFKKTISISMH